MCSKISCTNCSRTAFCFPIRSDLLLSDIVLKAIRKIVCSCMVAWDIKTNAGHSRVYLAKTFRFDSSCVCSNAVYCDVISSKLVYCGRMMAKVLSICKISSRPSQASSRNVLNTVRSTVSHSPSSTQCAGWMRYSCCAIVVSFCRRLSCTSAVWSGIPVSLIEDAGIAPIYDLLWQQSSERHRYCTMPFEKLSHALLVSCSLYGLPQARTCKASCIGQFRMPKFLLLTLKYPNAVK